MTRRKNNKSAVGSSAGGAAAHTNNAVGSSNAYSSHEVTRQQVANVRNTGVTSGSVKTLSPAATSQGSKAMYSSGPQPANSTSGPRPTSATYGPRPAYSTYGPLPANGMSGPRPAYGTSGPRPAYGTSGPRPAYGTSGPRPAYGTSGPRPAYGTSGPRPAYGTSGPQPAYSTSGSRSVYSTTGSQATYSTSGPRPAFSASPNHRQNYSKQDPQRDYASSTTSSNLREADNSAISYTTTSSSSDPKDKALIKKKKKPVNVKVSYVTKQIYIQPRYPILTVERLKDLDYHVDMLTVALGRRPKVYKHGKAVRFVPETNDEYKMIQRYLVKIESEEKIAWCSYSVAPGNSLKVNEQVRIVEYIKIEDKFKNLKIDDKAKPSDTKQADAVEKDLKSDVNNERKDTKTPKLTSKDEQVNKTKSQLKESKHGDATVQNQLSTSNQKQNDKKSTEKKRTLKDIPVLNISTVHECNKKRQSADVTTAICPANAGNKDRKATEAAAKDIYSPVSKPGPTGDDKKLNFVSVIRTQKMF